MSSTHHPSISVLEDCLAKCATLVTAACQSIDELLHMPPIEMITTGNDDYASAAAAAATTTNSSSSSSPTPVLQVVRNELSGVVDKMKGSDGRTSNPLKKLDQAFAVIKNTTTKLEKTSISALGSSRDEFTRHYANLTTSVR